MRKRFIRRNGNPQERAERPPSLLDVKDQQPVRGDRLPHRLVVTGEDGKTMRTIAEPTVEGVRPDDVAGQGRPPVSSSMSRNGKIVAWTLSNQRSGSRTVRTTLASGCAVISSLQKYAPGQSTIA